VLAMDVDLLVLDEPTAGLDNPSIALLEQLGRDLVAQGKSVVVVSHDLDFCFEALDRVVLMRDGQVILDRAWNAMAAPDYALLEETVGLPVQLQAALALEDTAPPELRQLLLQRDTLM
jgi:energy-coupling factor transporter ATP-binding protein EcfA2